MNTPKKKYRNKKLLDNNDNIEYSEEEAESLGISLIVSEEIEEDDEEYYCEDSEEVELTESKP